jgi:type VI secretion system protein ImpJ
MEWAGEDIILSQSFIQPCLTIAASNVLWKLVNEIRDEIGSRGRQMEAYKKERGVHTAEFGARDMVYLLALRSLNRYIPLFFHFTERKDAHPWTLYALIRQLVGELSSFSENINVTGEDKDGSRLLPKYDHEHLWNCFSKARTLISKLMEEITTGPDYILDLLFDSTYFVVEMTPAVFDSRNRFYLVIESEEDPQSILRPLTTIAKLSSRETLPLLIARALPGIKFQHLPFPPQELPRRTRALYFEIDHHGTQWAEVQKNNNIALYWDSAPRDLKVQMMIIGRSA